ncbi:DNRLRE domain-containing protein [Brevibacillus laterosporus]|nr:DNRLRE domain-containing protein [Brevibacillus laterosporus]
MFRICKLHFQTKKFLEYRAFFRGLVEFDLSKLPKEKELKRAKLKLYCGYLDSPIKLSLFEILDGWREHDVTWSNQLFNYKPKNHQLPLY